MLQGNGRIHHELKEINYIGMIQNGKMNGFGKNTSKNSIYTGDFVNNKYHGNGTIVNKARGFINAP